MFFLSFTQSLFKHDIAMHVWHYVYYFGLSCSISIRHRYTAEDKAYLQFISIFFCTPPLSISLSFNTMIEYHDCLTGHRWSDRHKHSYYFDSSVNPMAEQFFR